MLATIRPFYLAAGILVATLVCSGCATPHTCESQACKFSALSPPPSVGEARKWLGSGDLDGAVEALEKVQAAGDEWTHFLFERGTVYQQLGDLERSNRDFIAAARILDRGTTQSISKVTRNVLTLENRILEWDGTNAERRLLQAMIAVNALALGDKELAQVAAKRIIESLEPKPAPHLDDPFSRYVAAVALQLSGDDDNAKLQFAEVSRLTGRNIPALADRAEAQNELICFVFLANNSHRRNGLRHRAKVKAGGIAATYLTDTGWLDLETRAIPMDKTFDFVFDIAVVKPLFIAGTIYNGIAAVSNKNKVVREYLERKNMALTPLEMDLELSTPEPTWYEDDLYELWREPSVMWGTLPRDIMIVRVPYSGEATEDELQIQVASRPVSLRNPVGRYEHTAVTFYRSADKHVIHNTRPISALF
jgi:tetratricopeptide (TPR) repeat protein